MTKIFCIILISLLTACTSFLTSDNKDIERAEQIQTVYFEIVENPDYINNEPIDWQQYDKSIVIRAKELYKQNYQ